MTVTDTEAEVVAQLTREGAQPVPLDPAASPLLGIMEPAGAAFRTIDLSRYRDRPERRTGHVSMSTGTSLARYVIAHRDGAGVSVYADESRFEIAAVLNGHTANSTADDAVAGVPGWGDHRAVLAVRMTPAWTRWARRDGKLGGQVEFAEHIEDGAGELRTPDAATMLEIAQTLHVNRRVAYTSGVSLTDGARQFEFEETSTSTAGRKGSVQVPATFTIEVAPFEGGPAYEVLCRLRYRIADGGTLTIGYKIDRPEDLLRTAFDRIVGDVEEMTGITSYRGQPPV